MRRRWLALLRLVRQLSTDDAYERYVAHHEGRHADTPLLNRRDFYLQQQQHKWTGVNRCC
jgi:uncharacterized short protein YbdD (DUF466 family)